MGGGCGAPPPRCCAQALLEGSRAGDFFAGHLTAHHSDPATVDFGSTFAASGGGAAVPVVNIFAAIASTEECCSDRELQCEPDAANIRLLSSSSGSTSSAATLQVRKVECAADLRAPGEDALAPLTHSNDERMAVLALRSGLLFGTACEFTDEAALMGARNVDARSCDDDARCWSQVEYHYVDVSSLPGFAAHTLEDDGHIAVPLRFPFDFFGATYLHLRRPSRLPPTLRPMIRCWSWGLV